MVLRSRGVRGVGESWRLRGSDNATHAPGLGILGLRRSRAVTPRPPSGWRNHVGTANIGAFEGTTTQCWRPTLRVTQSILAARRGGIMLRPTW